jgi:hypothetical protein
MAFSAQLLWPRAAGLFPELKAKLPRAPEERPARATTLWAAARKKSLVVRGRCLATRKFSHPQIEVAVPPPPPAQPREFVLQEKAVGREKLFIHPKLMRLLTQEGNTFAPYKWQ